MRGCVVFLYVYWELYQWKGKRLVIPTGAAPSRSETRGGVLRSRKADEESTAIALRDHDQPPPNN
jgi:hypothetical protein